MVKCWAKDLGGCCNTKSGEHYISKYLWDTDKIVVKGLRSDEAKEIGINSLTANVLCSTHNSNLSSVDTGMKEIKDTIQEFYRFYGARKKIGSKNLDNFIKLNINGKILERWCIKFVIGLFYAVGKNSYWHETNTPPLNPPLNIVKAVFGLNTLEKPLGLYSDYIVGDIQRNKYADRTCEFLNHSTGGVVGAKIDFDGLRLLIWLKSEDVDFSLFKYGEKLIYRPQKFLFKDAKQALKFQWD